MPGDIVIYSLTCSCFFSNRQIPLQKSKKIREKEKTNPATYYTALPANQRFFVSSQKIGTAYIYIAKGSEWKSAPKKERGTLQPMDHGIKQAMRMTEFSMSMASSVIEAETAASAASAESSAVLIPSM